MCGLRRTTGSGRTSVRPLTRSPRGSWSTWSATPSGICWCRRRRLPTWPRPTRRRGLCTEVNAAKHSEIAAVPAERLAAERELLGPLPSLRLRIGTVTTRKVDRLSCVWFGSARYSVPTRLIGHTVELRNTDGRLLVVEAPTGEIVADHALVAPGEAWVADEHYGGPRPAPRRAVRPKTPAEKAFCALGPVAEAFITAAAAAGHTRLGPELEQLAALEAAHGRDALLAALERAVTFGRWHATDVRSILDAGAGTRSPARPGTPWCSSCPWCRPGRCRTTRSGRPHDRPTPTLAPDLAAGLRRLKLAAMRTLAPELLVTAKTQRWAPE